jgi:putative radical SAM enzyme (TIGR03279 family)
MGAIVSRIENGSIAARFGFQEKDEIITINRQLVQDIIDYYFLTSEHKLEINYVRDGFPHTTVIHKDPEETLGLDFESEVFDDIKRCPYKCLFCFVHQMPSGMRESLYIKDDDYRLSFLHGSYITLTSLAENDLRRITALRLSPLYVSVHATDPEVRAKMMGHQSAGNIHRMLKKLQTHNIEVHAQVVVVPGLNDGKILKKTLHDLVDLFPTVRSVAVVPVGLTKFRRNQPDLRAFRKSDAQQVYEMVNKIQARAEQRLGFPLVYMADEIYMLLEKDFPKHSHYGYYIQMGNGVGLARKFITEFNRRKRYLPEEMAVPRNVWVMTGTLGDKVLRPLVENFKDVKNLKVSLIPVENSYFGTSVTVTGLLSGTDIGNILIERLEKEERPDAVLIPDILVRDDMFLDEISVKDLEEKTGLKIQAVPSDACGLIYGVIDALDKHPSKTGGDKDLSDQEDGEVQVYLVPERSTRPERVERVDRRQSMKFKKHDPTEGRAAEAIARNGGMPRKNDRKKTHKAGMAKKSHTGDAKKADERRSGFRKGKKRFKTSYQLKHNENRRNPEKSPQQEKPGKQEITQKNIQPNEQQVQKNQVNQQDPQVRENKTNRRKRQNWQRRNKKRPAEKPLEHKPEVKAAESSPGNNNQGNPEKKNNRNRRYGMRPGGKKPERNETSTVSEAPAEKQPRQSVAPRNPETKTGNSRRRYYRTGNRRKASGQTDRSNSGQA